MRKLKKIEVKEYEVKRIKINEADVVISRRKDVYDFLAIGIACLEKTVKGKDAILKFAYKPLVSSKKQSTWYENGFGNISITIYHEI